MLSAIILARHLSAEDFAAYGYFQLTISMLGAYAALGLGTTAARLFAEAKNQCSGDTPKPLGTLLSVSLLGAAASACAIAAIPEDWLTSSLSVSRGMVAAGVAITALGAMTSGALLGLEKFKASVLISLLYGVFVLATASLSAVKGNAALAMTGIVLATLLQVVGQLAVALWALGWKRLTYRFVFSRIEFHAVFRVAGPLFLISLLSASGSWVVGRIILSADNGIQNFALYTIGLQWYSLALLLPGMVSRVVLPRLIQSRSKSDGEGAQLLRVGMLISVGAAFFVSMSAVLFGPWLGEMYGATYEIDRLFIGLYMAAAVVSAPTNTLGNALHATDGQLILLKNTVLWFVFLMICTFLAVGHGLQAWTGSFVHASAGAIQCLVLYVVCKRRRLI